MDTGLTKPLIDYNHNVHNFTSYFNVVAITFESRIDVEITVEHNVHIKISHSLRLETNTW